MQEIQRAPALDGTELASFGDWEDGPEHRAARASLPACKSLQRDALPLHALAPSRLDFPGRVVGHRHFEPDGYKNIRPIVLQCFTSSGMVCHSES